jgi:hypothetical protein
MTHGMGIKLRIGDGPNLRAYTAFSSLPPFLPPLPLSLEELFDGGSYFADLVAGREEAHDFPLLIEQKLGEVPGDDFSLSILPQLRTAPEKLIHGVRVGAIDFHLLEEEKL